MVDQAQSEPMSRLRSIARDRKLALAAFGGTPAVATGVVTPWPAAGKTHLDALISVITSGRYHRVNHPLVTSLEADLARWSGYWDVRAVASGTAALHVELDYYRQRGRKVVTAALNWPGAVAPIAFSNLVPEFVDVDLQRAAICESEGSQRLDSETAAVMVTHLFGGNVEVPGLRSAARRRGSAIVDDVCQSIAAIRPDGDDRPLDSDALGLSGNGAKHLGAGELGFVLTRDPALIAHVDRVSLASSSRHGERIFSPSTLGHNYRPNVFSSAVAASRIESLDRQLRRRRCNSRRLWRDICGLPGLLPLFDAADTRHAFLNLPMRIDTDSLDLPAGPHARDVIVNLLKAEGVPVSVWLTKPVFEYLPAWQGQWAPEEYPNTQTLLDTMFHVSEIAPPNRFEVMRAYAAAFEKVWSALPELRSELTGRI